MDRGDEQGVSDSEGRLERLLQVTGDGFWEWDLTGGGTYVSPGCYRILGCREGAPGPGLEALERRIDPGDRPVFRRAVERLLSGGAGADCFELRCRIRRRAGSHGWVLVRARVSVRDAAGRARRLSGTISDSSAQSCAEEFLRENERRYHGLYESMQEGFALHEIILDERGVPCDYRFLEVSPAFERLTGLSRAEAVGRRVRELIPDVEPEWIERYGRVALTGEPDHFESYSSRLGRWYEVLAFRPAPGRFATLFADVTGRRRAEERNRLNESRLRSLLEIAQHEAENVQELLDHTLAQALRLTSSRLGYIYHYDEARQELVLNTWSREVMAECSVLEPQTVYRLEKTGIWGEVIRQRQPLIVNDFGAPNPLKKGYPAGHVTLRKWMSVPVFAAGRIVAVVGVANKTEDYDQTDVLQLSLLMDSVWKLVGRWKAEQTLLASEKRYRRLFEAMQESFVLYEVILDGDGRPVDCRFLEVNPAFERLTGLSQEEVRGRTVRELFPDLGPEWVEHRGRVALTGEPAHFENYLRPLGKWFEVSAFSPAAGQVATLSVDISGRKKLEEQFLQAQKMETVGRLAGGVAHDFNNLLTIITGNTEIALAGMGPGEPLREELDEIRRAAGRAAELTRKLLAFSRRQIAAPKVIDLNTVLLDMERMLRRLIGEHIELRTVAAAGLHPVRIDPGQVEQVLTNLVVNARDAMPAGGRLLIETANARLDEAYRQAHPEVMEGEYVLLAVSDTGCGMDAEVRSHLFEPFFTTKPQGRGTGLGLSTCYGIVKQNGGSIWVYSEAGQGTSVKVYLPAAGEPAVPEEREPESAALPAGTETVLLVEDEPGIRRTAQRILAGCGFRVRTAANGEEALALDRARRPEGGVQLLITDVIMPGMGGRELGAKLLERYPGLKVLYMSGYTDNSIVHHGLLEEGIAFLHKPFTPAALVRKVREVLDG